MDNYPPPPARQYVRERKRSITITWPIILIALVILVCVIATSSWAIGKLFGGDEKTPQTAAEKTKAAKSGGDVPPPDVLAATMTGLASSVNQPTGNPPEEKTAIPGTPLSTDQATVAAFFEGVSATLTATFAPPTAIPTATTPPPVCVARVRDGDFLGSILDEFELVFEDGKKYYKYTECKNSEDNVVCVGRQEIDEKFTLYVGEWVEISDPTMTPEKCDEGGGKMTR